MLAKALEEIAAKAIEKITAAKHGWPILLLLATVVGGYFLVREVRTTPEAIATTSDPRFLTVLWFCVTAGLAYFAWQVLRPSVSVRGSILVVLMGAALFTWWRYVDLRPRVLLIDVTFEPGATFSTQEMGAFLGTLQQSHIVVTILPKPISPVSDGDRIDFAPTREKLLGQLRSESLANHTVLVTSKHLSGAGWYNPFYVTSPNFSVISTYGMVPSSAKDRQEILHKYMASMVPLAAMHGIALGKNQKLLEDRDPATEHGCLHDFSVDKQLMVEKLKRGPRMCAAENAEIEKVFGAEIASEYRAILATASVANPP